MEPKEINFMKNQTWIALGIVGFLALGIALQADNASVYTQPDGTMIIKDTDGTLIQKRADGSKLIRKPDGTTVEVRTDGSKLIKNADGTTIEVPKTTK